MTLAVSNRMLHRPTPLDTNDTLPTAGGGSPRRLVSPRSPRAEAGFLERLNLLLLGRLLVASWRWQPSRLDLPDECQPRTRGVKRSCLHPTVAPRQHASDSQ